MLFGCANEELGNWKFANVIMFLVCLDRDVSRRTRISCSGMCRGADRSGDICGRYAKGVGTGACVGFWLFELWRTKKRKIMYQIITALGTLKNRNIGSI